MSTMSALDAVNQLVRIGRDNPVIASEILATVDRLLNGDGDRERPPDACVGRNGCYYPPPTRRHDGRWNGHTNWHNGVHFDDLDPITQAKIEVRRAKRREYVEKEKEHLWMVEEKYGTPKRRGRQPVLIGVQLRLDQTRKANLTYTQGQVAELFIRKPATVGRWCQTGRINATKMGWDGHWIITHEELERIDRRVDLGGGLLPVDLNRNA